MPIALRVWVAIIKAPIKTRRTFIIFSFFTFFFKNVVTNFKCNWTRFIFATYILDDNYRYDSLRHVHCSLTNGDVNRAVSRKEFRFVLILNNVREPICAVFRSLTRRWALKPPSKIAITDRNCFSVEGYYYIDVGLFLFYVGEMGSYISPFSPY